ncbi:MAG: hypothetical protein WCH46_01735 [bacterium]
MKNLIKYFGLILRLVFLPMEKHLVTRRQKALLIVATNVVMIYAVFITVINPTTSTYHQVQAVLGPEESLLNAELNRLNHIIFKQARSVSSVTIIPTAELEAQQERDSIASANEVLSVDDKLFLYELAARRK